MIYVYKYKIFKEQRAEDLVSPYFDNHEYELFSTCQLCPLRTNISESNGHDSQLSNIVGVVEAYDQQWVGVFSRRPRINRRKVSYLSFSRE